MLKLSDTPPMRPEAVTSVTDVEGEWWVAHTKSRNEKALAWDLHRLGIDYYLPMLLRETISGGRKRRQMRPLFMSYMFFAGGKMERYHALTTNRIANVLPVTERDRFVTEIAALETAIDTGQTLTLYNTLEAGQRVRVIRGPMEGHEGNIVRVDGVERVILFVSILGRGAELEIHSDHLEPID